MKKIAFLALPLLLAGQSAFAGGAEGNGAISLAALVGEHSPHLTPAEKALLDKYLNSQPKAPYPAGKKITVIAEAVTCRISDIDITSHSCELTFGVKKVSFEGRKAHELYATLIEAGAPSDGAAGSIYEGIANLDCTVNPAEVKQEGGGGATCKFTSAK